MVKMVKLHQRAKFHGIGPNVAEIWQHFHFSSWQSPVSCTFKFSTVRRLKRVELRDCAKCGRNRSNRGRDMAISRFFPRWWTGGRAPSWICYVWVWTSHKGHLVVFISVQNLVGIDAVVFIICMFFDFMSLAWKPLFTPPKLGFLGILPPKWGAMSTKPQKGISWCESASFEPSCAKICGCVWPVGEFPKKKGINK